MLTTALSPCSSPHLKISLESVEEHLKYGKDQQASQDEPSAAIQTKRAEIHSCIGKDLFLLGASFMLWFFLFVPTSVGEVVLKILPVIIALVNISILSYQCIVILLLKRYILAHIKVASSSLFIHLTVSLKVLLVKTGAHLMSSLFLCPWENCMFLCMCACVYVLVFVHVRPHACMHMQSCRGVVTSKSPLHLALVPWEPVRN